MGVSKVLRAVRYKGSVSVLAVMMLWPCVSHAELKINPYPRGVAPASSTAASPVSSPAPVAPAPVPASAAHQIYPSAESAPDFSQFKQDMRGAAQEVLEDADYSAAPAYAAPPPSPVYSPSPQVVQRPPISHLPLPDGGRVALRQPVPLSAPVASSGNDVGVRAVQQQASSAQPLYARMTDSGYVDRGVVSAPPTANTPRRYAVPNTTLPEVVNLNDRPVYQPSVAPPSAPAFAEVDFTPAPAHTSVPEAQSYVAAAEQETITFNQPRVVVASAPVQQHVFASAPVAPAFDPNYGKPPARFHAQQGAGLQDILRLWSQQAGVELVWRASKDFSTPAPVNVGDSFEQAVQALLEQYESEHERPVGSLHINPKTGHRILMIEVVRGV
jgi:hypothetical protein